MPPSSTEATSMITIGSRPWQRYRKRGLRNRFPRKEFLCLRSFPSSLDTGSVLSTIRRLVHFWQRRQLSANRALILCVRCTLYLSTLMRNSSPRANNCNGHLNRQRNGPSVCPRPSKNNVGPTTLYWTIARTHISRALTRSLCEE